MPEYLDHGQRLRNGKGGPQLPVGAMRALGNTQPRATLGSTFGTDVPVPVAEGAASLEFSFEGPTGPQTFVIQTVVVQGVLHVGPPDPALSSYARTAEGVLQRQSPQKVLKPAGQVVLYKKVMEQWGFTDEESSTLLGFEDAADIRDIYDGRKPVGQRDANDRLRAVLRIAADVDALFQDVNAIRDWLNEPQKDLGGQTPRALLNEGSMENLLKVKYYVSFLSGR